MYAIICAAGQSTRIKDVCKHYNVESKCLLPVGGSTILDHIIKELYNVGIIKLIVVTGEHNHQELSKYLSHYLTKIEVVLQKADFVGTTAAVVSGMTMTKGPFFLVWADMLFRFPHGFQSTGLPHNIVFTTSVSQRQSTRFDGIVCSGNRVMAFSPRSVEKPGPFLINTGVYYMKDIKMMMESINRIIKTYGARDYNFPENLELPIELVLQDMLYKGSVFDADSLDFFIDMGTSETYVAAIKSLFGEKK